MQDKEAADNAATQSCACTNQLYMMATLFLEAWMNLKLEKVKYRSTQKHKSMTAHLKKPANVNILTFHNHFGDQEVRLSLTYDLMARFVRQLPFPVTVNTIYRDGLLLWK